MSAEQITTVLTIAVPTPPITGINQKLPAMTKGIIGTVNHKVIFGSLYAVRLRCLRHHTTHPLYAGFL